MQAPDVPTKIRYTLQYCSGEDPDFPARELLYHSPQTRGWHSPRFCKYPQQVVLRLEAPTKIQQIQVLSHEYMIATRMDIHIGTRAPGEDHPDRVEWKRLGYLGFDSNERSGYLARELKSVHVTSRGSLLQLTVHRCHINKLNIYNQVGVVAINVVGKLLPEFASPPGHLEVLRPMQAEPIVSAGSAATMADIALDVNIDPTTANKIREMGALKDKAVASEDYDEAKRLKQAIECLKVLGQKIALLEAKKRAAVDREDYDTAKLLKGDIEKLRGAGEVAAVGEPKARRSDPEEIFSRVLGKKVSVSRQSSEAGGSNSGSATAVPVLEEVPPTAAPSSVADGIATPDGQTGTSDFVPLEPAPSLGPELGPGSSLLAHGKTKHEEYDDRPAQGSGNYADMIPTVIDPTPTKPAFDTEIQARPSANVPEGFPPDLPAPEPLLPSVAKEAEPLAELAGGYIAECFYSRNWQLRDAAVRHMMGDLESLKTKMGKGDCFKVLCRVVLRALKDKVANVFHRGVSSIPGLVEAFGLEVGSRDMQQAASDFIPILVVKTGDTNVRIRDSAKETVMLLAKRKDVNMKALAHVFLKPVKNQNAWRPLLGKLQLAKELIGLRGVGKPGAAFEVEPLMGFVGKALNSANAEVRSAAVQVALEVSKSIGPAVQKYFPADLNPKIKEQLVKDLAGGASPVKANGKVAQRKGKTKGSPKKSKEPPPKDQQESDDPSLYEAEVKRREKEHGKDHPDVAESLGNLAILYNQRQEYKKAQPLLERALEIYEAVHGVEHPDVAHALTDLAVLHLEQGRDEIGHPLLERALMIQEKHLGPDHPDVLAIKDVLNGDD